MNVKIKDLTWDASIYPRTAKSRQTISAYVEALDAGAAFPPRYKGSSTTQTAKLPPSSWTAPTAAKPSKKKASKRSQPLNGRTTPLITRKIKYPFSLNQLSAIPAMAID